VGVEWRKRVQEESGRRTELGAVFVSCLRAKKTKTKKKKTGRRTVVKNND